MNDDPTILTATSHEIGAAARAGASVGAPRKPARHDLTRGPIVRHLLGMAAFIGVGLVVQTLYFLIDLYFVARASATPRWPAWPVRAARHSS